MAFKNCTIKLVRRIMLCAEMAFSESGQHDDQLLAETAQHFKELTADGAKVETRTVLRRSRDDPNRWSLSGVACAVEENALLVSVTSGVINIVFVVSAALVLLFFYWIRRFWRFFEAYLAAVERRAVEARSWAGNHGLHHPWEKVEGREIEKEATLDTEEEDAMEGSVLERV